MRFLFVLQIPPPFHGVSLMNQILLDYAKKINISFTHVPINAAKSVDSIGRFGVDKLICSLKVAYKIFTLREKYTISYFALSIRGYAFYRDFLFILIAKILKKKVILHLHGTGFKKRTVIDRFTLKIMFRNAYIIQHSLLLKSDIEYLSYKRVFYLPNGIPDTFSKYRNTPKLNAKKNINIIFLSNLFEFKGCFVLLEAINRLKNTQKSSRYHFIGNWESLKTKKRFLDYIDVHEISSFIGEIGPKYNKEKFDFLQKMDILVFPTLYEAFGNVALEAMMFEIPVIATDEGSLLEIIDDYKTGFIVPKGDVYELANKIDILSKNHELRKAMGIEGRKRYLQYFTLETYQHNIHNILSKVNN